MLKTIFLLTNKKKFTNYLEIIKNIVSLENKKSFSILAPWCNHLKFELLKTLLVR